MPRRDDLHRILVLGSGPIKIGQRRNSISQAHKRCAPSVRMAMR